uniref:Uncharacterized protein n=1 Tax=Ditylenchus dipsaci TaxID=166011 RepID=A0A915DM09_9BILA
METPNHSPTASIGPDDEFTPEAILERLQLVSNPNSVSKPAQRSFEMCIVQSPPQQAQSSRSSSGTLPSLAGHSNYSNTNLPPPLTRSFSNLTAVSTPTSRKTSRRESMFATKSSSVDNYCMQSCDRQRLLVYREIDMYRMRLLDTENSEDSQHALPTILEPCLPSLSTTPSTSTQQKSSAEKQQIVDENPYEVINNTSESNSDQSTELKISSQPSNEKVDKSEAEESPDFEGSSQNGNPQSQMKTTTTGYNTTATLAILKNGSQLLGSNSAVKKPVPDLSLMDHNSNENNLFLKTPTLGMMPDLLRTPTINSPTKSTSSQCLHVDDLNTPSLLHSSTPKGHSTQAFFGDHEPLLTANIEISTVVSQSSMAHGSHQHHSGSQTIHPIQTTPSKSTT